MGKLEDVGGEGRNGNPGDVETLPTFAKAKADKACNVSTLVGFSDSLFNCSWSTEIFYRNLQKQFITGLMKSSTVSHQQRMFRFLILFLWLIALHSFIVGLFLILFPPGLLNRFGFEVTEKFFPTQAGVFHLVMAAIYIFAVRRIKRCVDLVQLSIFIKFLAAIFLFSYYFFIESIALVILSGAGDLLMGMILLILFIRSGLSQNNNAEGNSRAIHQ